VKARASLAFSLAVFASALAFAGGKEKVPLIRRTKAGDRLTGKEHYRSEKEQHWKGEGQGSAGGEEVEVVEREYAQEVVTESPFVVKRDYTLSTRLKGKPKDDRLEPVRTSIHGKTVVLRPEGPVLEGGELSKDDRDNLDGYERIVYALLPKQEVAAGDEWKVGDEIGRALFRGGFDAANMKSQATVKLEALKPVDGRRAAKLAVKVAIQVTATETLPQVALELKGSALFLIEEGMFADAALDGTARYEVKNAAAKNAFVSDERVSWKLHAEFVLAGMPKAVAKDDELAKAKAVACPKGHKFPNEFACCASCGKGLDPTTRRCPGGCPPILRFCPLCGDPLAPAPP
jgi:hypothetical protein